LSGRGDEKAADAAAVEAMRAALNDLAMDGTVVIGEGERDEAPMLYIGEKVGSPLVPDRRSILRLIRWKAPPSPPRPGPNALAVLAVAEEGNLLNAPDVYMDKLAVGPGYPDGIIDLNKTRDRKCRSGGQGQGRGRLQKSSSACWIARAMRS
jgi:fructose-1,6-bisphosphatase II / sedoheptulose-1,7-bisphosphatase